MTRKAPLAQVSPVRTYQLFIGGVLPIDMLSIEMGFDTLRSMFAGGCFDEAAYKAGIEALIALGTSDQDFPRTLAGFQMCTCSMTVQRHGHMISRYGDLSYPCCSLHVAAVALEESIGAEDIHPRFRVDIADQIQRSPLPSDFTEEDHRLRATRMRAQAADIEELPPIFFGFGSPPSDPDDMVN